MSGEKAEKIELNDRKIIPVINLNNLTGIPTEFIQELGKFQNSFKDSLYFDALIKDPSIANLVRKINAYCLTKSVVGFHYTRAIASDIVLEGLKCRKGEEIRRTFISKYGNLFTQNELNTIHKSWDRDFNHHQQISRDNILYFNFTTTALYDYGAEHLLSNFGGEQVYMPLQDLQVIGEKIKNIGTPLILKCILNPNTLNTYLEYPWGRIAVSTYHCKVNPEASQFDQDGYQKIPVAPKDIEIIECFEIQKKYRYI